MKKIDPEKEGTIFFKGKRRKGEKETDYREKKRKRRKKRKKSVDFKDRNRVISISNQRKRRVSGKLKGMSEKNMKKFVDKVNK